MTDLNDDASVIKRKSGTNNVIVSTATISSNNQNFKTYKFRWFILGVVCIMHVSHAINGFCFTTIADKTAEFYNVDYIQVNLLSTISMIVILPAGFVSLLVIDNFGIRVSLIISGWLNFIGALISFISSIDDSVLFPSDHKYSVLMLGRVICSISGPFSFLVTTKFANSWFTADQRALANTISLVSGTLGFLIGSFMSPLIVNSDTNYIHQMPVLNSINAGISFIPALLATFITRSSPITPPHAQENSEKVEEKDKVLREKVFVYFQHVRHLLKSLHFWLLFVSFTIAFSVFNTIAILLQQLFCIRGYTDSEIGLFSGTMILSGIIGSLLAGYIADKTKRLEEIAKICFLVSCLANIFFSIFQTYDNDNGLIRNLMVIAFCLIGAFGFPLLPVSIFSFFL
jgi:FLVCR family MFS transporter 7